MNILVLLIPVSIFLGGVGLAAFFWMIRARQFDDPKGDAERILSGDYDEFPKDE